MCNYANASCLHAQALTSTHSCSQRRAPMRRCMQESSERKGLKWCKKASPFQATRTTSKAWAKEGHNRSCIMKFQNEVPCIQSLCQTLCAKRDTARIASAQCYGWNKTPEATKV